MYRRSPNARMGGAYEGHICKIIARRSSIHIHHFKENRMPNKIQGDKSKEFVNRKFKSYLKYHRVHFFATENDDIKASVVECFNRTPKSKMWRYFTYTRKKRFVDTLDDLVLSYNNGKHRTIRMSAADVTSEAELDLWRDMHNIPVPR